VEHLAVPTEEELVRVSTITALPINEVRTALDSRGRPRTA
jgi:hypothetical protein